MILRFSALSSFLPSLLNTSGIFWGCCVDSIFIIWQWIHVKKGVCLHLVWGRGLFLHAFLLCGWKSGCEARRQTCSRLLLTLRGNFPRDQQIDNDWGGDHHPLRGVIALSCSLWSRLNPRLKYTRTFTLRIKGVYFHKPQMLRSPSGRRFAGRPLISRMHSDLFLELKCFVRAVKWGLAVLLRLSRRGRGLLRECSSNSPLPSRQTSC